MWFGSSRTLILRALITLTFGLLLIGWPTISLTVLILLYGAFALVDGALMLAAGLEMPSRTTARRAALLTGGLAMIIGLVTFVSPSVTELVLVVLIAVRALIVGIAEAVTAVSIGRHDAGAWWLGGVGLVSVALATLLLLYPGTGMVALVRVIGLYAVAIGCVGIARASLRTMAWYA